MRSRAARGPGSGHFSHARRCPCCRGHRRTHIFHRFAAQDGGAGVSGAVIIAESHLAIHTWPEHRFAAVDFFSCGPVDMDRGLAILKAALGARDEVRLALERGGPLRPVTPSR